MFGLDKTGRRVACLPEPYSFRQGILVWVSWRNGRLDLLKLLGSYITVTFLSLCGSFNRWK